MFVENPFFAVIFAQTPTNGFVTIKLYFVQELYAFYRLNGALFRWRWFCALMCLWGSFGKRANFLIINLVDTYGKHRIPTIICTKWKVNRWNHMFLFDDVNRPGFYNWWSNSFYTANLSQYLRKDSKPSFTVMIEQLVKTRLGAAGLLFFNAAIGLYSALWWLVDTAVRVNFKSP